MFSAGSSKWPVQNLSWNLGLSSTSLEQCLENISLIPLIMLHDAQRSSLLEKLGSLGKRANEHLSTLHCVGRCYPTIPSLGLHLAVGCRECPKRDNGSDKRVGNWAWWREAEIGWERWGWEVGGTGRWGAGLLVSGPSAEAGLCEDCLGRRKNFVLSRGEFKWLALWRAFGKGELWLSQWYRHLT